MSVTTNTIADILDTAAKPAAGLLGALAKGPARAIVEPAVEQALGLAADLVRGGHDAAATIQRLRRSPELLAQVRAEERFADALDKRFPNGPDTDPGGPPPVDIYEGEDGAQ